MLGLIPVISWTPRNNRVQVINPLFTDGGGWETSPELKSLLGKGDGAAKSCFSNKSCAYFMLKGLGRWWSYKSEYPKELTV